MSDTQFFEKSRGGCRLLRDIVNLQVTIGNQLFHFQKLKTKPILKTIGKQSPYTRPLKSWCFTFFGGCKMVHVKSYSKSLEMLSDSQESPKPACRGLWVGKSLAFL